MKTKNYLVSFIAIAAILFLMAPAVNADDPTRGTPFVAVNDVSARSSPGVVSGENVEVEVWFISDMFASDMRFRAELEGEKVDVEATEGPFNIEEGVQYRKSVNLNIPSELEDSLSDNLDLEVKIWNNDHEYEEDFELRVQRQPYKADVKLISVPQTIDAGDEFPVEIAIENAGYNDLDDVYVVSRVPELGLERATYFSDIVSLECDDDATGEENFGVPIDRKCNEDNEDTAFGSINMEMPFEAKAGTYNLEVEVVNDDTSTTRTRKISVRNDFSSGNIIVSGSKKTVSAGEEAQYTLTFVNPTDQVKVYRVVTESSGSLSSSTDEPVVAVPAGESETVKVSAEAEKSGEYNFGVSVFSGEELLDTVSLSLKAESEGTSVANPVVILTIVLAIIFVVLIVVLIVLLGKKPERSEEFGESYY